MGRQCFNYLPNGLRQFNCISTNYTNVMHIDELYNMHEGRCNAYELYNVKKRYLTDVMYINELYSIHEGID